MKFLVNEEKVIKVTSKKSQDFACPCSLCEAQRACDKFIKENIDTLKQKINEVIETTPAHNENVILDIQIQNQRENINRYTKEVCTSLDVEKSIKMLLIRHASFIEQFNKKYRYMYVCLLREKILDMLHNIQLHKKEYFTLSAEARLWIELEVQMYLKSAKEVFTVLKEKEIIEPEYIQAHLDSIESVRKKYNQKIRSSFNDSLNIPDFNPSLHAETFRSYFHNT